MKAIKTIICSRCKTELQYTKEDIEIRVCKGHVDNPIMVVQYVPCPICHKENDITEEC